jgi:anti-sigma factor RsiW
MHSQQHPDLEQLDRLRAGLLDDRPQEKALLEAHLAGCDACQARTSSWAQLGPGALGPDLDPATIRRDLRAARARALDSSAPRHRHAFAPYATAALLLIAVTVGIWTGQHWLQPQPQLTVQAQQEVPDIYEDLDFYLWLADQQDRDSEMHSDNPNNT